ncbi:MAG: hypothetical protein Q4F18_01200 [Clostridia bacterium]|nr:hypothetical protein [Clostridia bacterium]
MTHVLLYWNHICVLHRQEKEYLRRIAEALRDDGIELEVRCFGLGYGEHMSEYLARRDAVLPDVIVSADLEVFENPLIFSRFRDGLYPARDWSALRPSPVLTACTRDRSLIPFAAIPMVYFTRNPEGCKKPIPEIEDLAFGGINNSAAKSIVKSVWERYGKDAAERVLARGSVSDMPIGAYQQVRTGERETALVPSLYALRADGMATHLVTPQEGPVLVASYICARRSIPEAAARRVLDAVMSRELCNFYVQNGDLILFPSCAEGHSTQEGESCMIASAPWLSAVSPEEFYALYRKYLPSAHDGAGATGCSRFAV